MKSLALSEDKALCLCPDNVSVAVLLACCDWVVPLTSKRGYLQNAISCDLITIWPAKVIFPWWWTLWPIWRSRLSTSFRVAASPMLPALCVSDAAFSGDLKAAQASASTPRAQSAAATAGSAVAHSKLRSTTTRRQLGYGNPLSQAFCDNATFVRKVAVALRLREARRSLLHCMWTRQVSERPARMSVWTWPWASSTNLNSPSCPRSDCAGAGGNQGGGGCSQQLRLMGIL